MADQIDFYLLKQSESSARYIYACRIANKAFGQGMKVYMRTDNVDQSAYLDKLLWTYSQESFVPHTIREQKTDWASYPVQIGSQNSGCDDIDLLISLSADVPEDFQRYSRVADLIINDPEQKQWGRSRFRHYRDQGIEPKTHNI